MKNTKNASLNENQYILLGLADKFFKLENSIAEFNVTINFLKEQLEEYHKKTNDIKVIDLTLNNTVDRINRLEAKYKEALEINDKHINKINEKLAAINEDIQKLPLLYQSKKSKRHDLLDYIKAAPAFITILSVLVATAWLYIQKYLI